MVDTGSMSIRRRLVAWHSSKRVDDTFVDIWRERLSSKIFQQVFVLVAVAVSILPLYTAFITSLYPSGQVLGGGLVPPKEPTLTNYSKAWNDLEFSSMFVNSLTLTVLSAFGTTALAAAAAFALVRLKFFGRRLLFVFIIGAIAIPPIVIIIPLFLMMTDMGLVNTIWAAPIAEIGLLLPFGIFLIYSYPF